MKAIQVTEIGGPEKHASWWMCRCPSPGPGQALVKIAASGVNFIDIYFRTGLYKSDLPVVAGQRRRGHGGSGGRRASPKWPRATAWPTPWSRGSYAEYAAGAGRAAGQDSRRPSISSTAAAAMLQGMTAHYLTHSTYPLKQGDTCLVHAAAGGAGALIVQMAKMLRRARVRHRLHGREGRASRARPARTRSSSTPRRISTPK